MEGRQKSEVSITAQPPLCQYPGAAGQCGGGDGGKGDA